MRLVSAALAGVCCAAALPPRPVFAMQFELADVTPNEVMISGRGPIVRGDAARLDQALTSVPATKRLLGLALDSPGGTVLDGAELARMVHEKGLTVVVPASSKCASACFLILAASPHRLVANDALIGVHGANDDGQDTEVAMAMTTAMARAAGDLGVPPVIIGKMVGTSPSRIEWLTPADLREMGVVIYEDADAANVIRDATAAPVAQAQPPAAPATLSADVGRADRLAWQGWLATLSGPYRDGALFWAAQRVMPEPASCFGPNGVSRGDFTLGCEAAKQRLALSDARSRASADYRAGWNGQSPTGAVADVRPVAGEAAFEGAVFCGPTPTHLTLKVLGGSDPAHQRAMYHLGGNSADRSGGQAPGMIEGRLDLSASAIEFQPATKLSPPDATGPLGLQGRSEDGGRTFTGRVTTNPRCTMFTLKRMN